MMIESDQATVSCSRLINCAGDFSVGRRQRAFHPPHIPPVQWGSSVTNENTEASWEVGRGQVGGAFPVPDSSPA